jgi:hypothetical protein
MFTTPRHPLLRRIFRAMVGDISESDLRATVPCSTVQGDLLLSRAVGRISAESNSRLSPSTTCGMPRLPSSATSGSAARGHRAGSLCSVNPGSETSTAKSWRCGRA